MQNLQKTNEPPVDLLHTHPTMDNLNSESKDAPDANQASAPIRLEINYKRGMIWLTSIDAQIDEVWLTQFKVLNLFVYDERLLIWVAPSYKYRDLVLNLYKQPSLQITDSAKHYESLSVLPHVSIAPRRHQTEALKAWKEAGRVGVVSLPTGAGKTILAMMAIDLCRRSTLIVVPTIDLLHQWHTVVTKTFQYNAGLLGGGSHEIKDITISTYDSAAMHAENLGNRFGLVVFDECHHLPGLVYSHIARTSLAPFRLGLSATVERQDGGEELIYELLGDLVYEGRIDALEQKTLSPYDTIQVQVDMTAEEKESWKIHRQIYTQFIKRHQVNLSDANGWQQFIIATSRYPDGPAAMKAYRAQKKLAQSSTQKLVEIWNILRKHQGERVIIFTDDNETAYAIGRLFLIPILTHLTKPTERKLILDEFRSGFIKVIGTSKVLNEGVDVPEASVGIVVSGSGAVREHVQRLGRILRHQPGKRATLYELISKGTGEQSTSERRRQHYAYQRPTSIHAP